MFFGTSNSVTALIKQSSFNKYYNRKNNLLNNWLYKWISKLVNWNFTEKIFSTVRNLLFFVAFWKYFGEGIWKQFSLHFWSIVKVEHLLKCPTWNSNLEWTLMKSSPNSRFISKVCTYRYFTVKSIWKYSTLDITQFNKKVFLA